MLGVWADRLFAHEANSHALIQLNVFWIFGAVELLKRFQAKWVPVRVKKTRQIKNLEPRFDSIETEKALVGQSRRLLE
jgi:hypothetical protein